MQLMFALMIMYRLKHGNCILASNLAYGKQGVAHPRFLGDISRSQRVRITFTFCRARPIVRGVPLRMTWLGNVPAVGFYTEDDFRHFFLDGMARSARDSGCVFIPVAGWSSGLSCCRAPARRRFAALVTAGRDGFGRLVGSVVNSRFRGWGDRRNAEGEAQGE